MGFVVEPAGVDPDVLRAATREEANRIAVRRVRIAIVVATVVMPFYALLDRVLGQPNVSMLDTIKLVTLVVPILSLFILRSRKGPEYVRLLMFGLIVVMTIGSGVSAILSQNFVAHDMLATMVSLFTGALIPWGVGYQLASIVVLATSVLAVTGTVAGSLAPLLSYPALVALTTWGTSLYIASEIMHTIRALTEQNLQRNLAQRRLEEEARVSAALAHVGQELIAHTDQAALLTRLCKLAAELLPCDCSWTILREGSAGNFRIVAQHGFANTVAESMSILEIPGGDLGNLMRELKTGVAVRSQPSRSPIFDRVREHLGIHTRMYAPLWQGEDLRGMLAAAHRDPDASFSPQQERLLLGMGQLASLALETNRLIDELERANRFKSDFVASMSHELRTPLNVILGYQDLLLDGTFGSLAAEQSEVLRRTEKNARELLDLITATLDLSRMDSQGPELDLRDVDPRELLDELREELSFGMENPQLQVSWEADDKVATIRTDRVKLRMVLKNLVHNAIKFTPRGRVHVQAAEEASGVTFTISDTGIGIAPEQRDKIFDAFHQIEPSKTFGGVGLGLYIVRRLIAALGGEVELDSEMGVGSTFRVRLPVDYAPPSRVSAAG